MAVTIVTAVTMLKILIAVAIVKMVYAKAMAAVVTIVN